MTETRTILDDVGLLNEIAAFAGELVTKPRSAADAEWQEQCDVLDDRLKDAVEATGYRHVVNNMAPITLQIVSKAIAARRRGDDRNAERFAAAVGMFIEYVRADAQALLAKAKEA